MNSVATQVVTDGLPIDAESPAERRQARLAAEIRRLRYQLASPDVLANPSVYAELNELYKQVWSVQDRRAGRHRAQARQAAEQVQDVAGFELKPDPLTATTSAQLVARLREYRQWAGEPPFRKIAAQARQKVAHSTIYVALNSDELPSLKVVIAVIVGCGGGEEDQRAFATAWRRLKTGKLETGPVSGAAAFRAMPGWLQDVG